ncbi:hypothetical protein BKA70DRAFT_1573186, partial [Coprinopsis sp. MPI-PUGE-AT-0042]
KFYLNRSRRVNANSLPRWTRKNWKFVAEPKGSVTRSLSQDVKELEEKASRVYESDGLVDEAKALEESATGTPNRAKEGISGLVNRQRLDERLASEN